MKTYIPTELPQLHPDPLINAQVLVEALCARLNTTRIGLEQALSMNVVTPAALAMKNNVRYALAESDPGTLDEQHANCG